MDGRINVGISGLVSLIDLEWYRVKTYAKTRRNNRDWIKKWSVPEVVPVELEIVEDREGTIRFFFFLVTDTWWVQVQSKTKARQVEVIVTCAGYRAAGKRGLGKENR